MRTAGLLLCALAAAAVIFRILWLLTKRMPVLAHSENTDVLGETTLDDTLNPEPRLSGARGFSPINSIDVRLDYEVGGKTYKHDEMVHDVEGFAMTAPDDMPTLWVNPADPTQVEARGPGFWLILLILIGGVAAAILQI